MTLDFQAQASVATGNYCNEAWIEPGGTSTSSGMTAKIQVGTPPDNLCTGAAVQLVKTVDPNVAPNNTLTTFAYTISIENVGSVALNMSLTRDLLPASFTYVADSTSGTITSANPTTTFFQGKQRLDWSFLPKVQFQPGETKTLVFQAQATLNGGDFWNEAWATFDEFASSVYTWPTALVKAAGVFEIAASDGRTKTSSELWLGDDFSSTQQWNLGK